MKIVNSIGHVIVDLNSESVKDDVLSLRYDTYDHEFVKLANDVIQAIDKVKEYHKVKSKQMLEKMQQAVITGMYPADFPLSIPLKNQS
jgi:hypothetical protein